MGIDTHPVNAPGGTERDSHDFQRLRHARERTAGFPVGQYLQPPPMLFTRDGHNVFLGDMYRGHSAFLICAGPSLQNHDLSMLEARGILTLAVNNAAAVFRPHLWCSVDDPGNFCDAIWHDPGITKFVPLCHMEKTFLVRDENENLVPSTEKVGDMPAVFGYRRNESFVAGQWLREDTFNWGNHSRKVDEDGNKGSRSVMYVALRLLYYLGIRRVFLLGCDFRMEHGRRNYAFEQDRSRASVRGNNSSYRILNRRLTLLKPHFQKAGFEVFNCTPGSGLMVFPQISFEEAVGSVRSVIPRRIVTRGMYDRSQRERDTAKEKGQPPRAKHFSSCSHSADDTSAVLPELTLVLPLDETGAEVLPHTWPTWIRHYRILDRLPLLIIHDPRVDCHGRLPESLREKSELKCIKAWTDPGAPPAESMFQALVEAPARHVETEWYLKLDPQAVAFGGRGWPLARWFAPDREGQLPVFVAGPWGYTKPSNAIKSLDDWGDQIPGLREFPRLNLPHHATEDRIRHETIISWCFFGNTAWTKEIADFVGTKVPIPRHGTFLHYCAARRREYYHRIQFKDFGWEHSFGWTREQIVRRCRRLMPQVT